MYQTAEKSLHDLYSTDLIIVKRMSVGHLITKDKHGEPAFLRCYHSYRSKYIECDCQHEDNLFTLSLKSQKLMEQGRLILDTHVIDQQRLALSITKDGESIFNVYLPTGPGM